MTFQAQGADVFKVALTSTFHHWNDMVGIPQSLTEMAAQAPIQQSFQAGGAAQPFDPALGFQAIDPALRADAAVAFEDLFAEISGVAAQTPFFDTPGGAECPTAGRHLEITPAAQSAPVGSCREIPTVSPAAGHCSFCAHAVRLVLTAGSFHQKIANREQDGAGMHLTLRLGVSRGVGKACDHGRNPVYSAIA